MLFNSLDFFIFLFLTFSTYWLLASCYKCQNFLIVLVSFFFYGCWDWKFLLLLLFVIIQNFFSALLLDYVKSPTKRKTVAFFSISLDLFILGVFKYYNFFIGSISSLLYTLGVGVEFKLFNLLLPVGISFYTFKAISYVVDVYKGEVKPCHDVIAFVAYMSFFPVLLAGPIDRASCLLKQFKNKRYFNEQLASDGCRQMLWGFYKKVFIADNCKVVVDQIFGGQFQEPGYVFIIVALLYSIQIYCDFSGYSDIAIGCSKLFGIQLTQNFSFPYFSHNIIEFWRRWHISLMSWLRDYVYIPMGGSRGAIWVMYRNILIVWVISGLWHGANSTFICWGVYHGLLIIIYRQLNKTKDRKDKKHGMIQKGVYTFLTFIFVSIGWILFRSNSINDAFCFMEHIFANSWSCCFLWEHLNGLQLNHILPAILLMMLVEWHHRRMDHGLQLIPDGIIVRYRPIRYAVYVFLFMITMAYAGAQSEFLYFKF